MSEEICFLCKFSEILSLLPQPISALCYCTVFSVLLWMWPFVCSSYCHQHNAVSFSTALHTALYRSIYILLAWSSLGWMQGIFSVLLWMWQSVCSSYCRQHNAVSFSTVLHAALYRYIYSLLACSSLGTLQGFLGAFAKFRTVTVSFVMSDGPSLYM